MNTIKTILIDDEPLVRQEVRYLLKQHSDFEIIAEAAYVDEAKQKIETLKPDIIFLDIQMPGKTGFDLLEELDECPMVIFITAYDQFAIKAFENNALDYVLKPIRKERLEKSLDHARKLLAERKADKPKPTSLHAESRLFIKDGNKCFFVRLGDIFLFENAGNYAKVYFGKETAMVHKSITQLEETLPIDIFFRANRSEIIHLYFIEKVSQSFKGALVAELKNGRVVEISSRQSVRFRELLSL